MVTESLAAVLRAHRDDAGLTQEELAERSGVSARTISDTERGIRSTIYKDTAVRLADALLLDEGARESFVAIARGRPIAARATVPRAPTALVGRDRELSLVLDTLRDARLVTLTGPGGIGKTRLALEVAAASRDATFVPLGSVRDAALVPSVVSHAVGASATPGPPIDAIASHLGGRRMLLVLDTFEHLLDAAVFVGELLERCPEVRILATSRERLGLRDERDFPVPTLDDSWAMTLFVDRARAVIPDLALDDGLVSDVCKRLDGLPLAIELAAARLRHLSLASLRDHLEHRLDVLTGGPRDLPPRQHTMRSTVAWSYDLLDPDERVVFGALSVFAGGWTLDAARAVSASGDVLEPLSALVDKSLVVFDDDRYGMLDVIREFAEERVESGVSARAHAEYFVALAERAEPEFGGAGQDEWFDRIEADHDNIRAALRFTVDGGDAEVAQRLSGSLWQFWRAREHFDEGRLWLRRAIALPSEGSVRAKALWGAAWLAYHQDDYAAADALSIDLLALARRTGDATDTRNGLTVRGMVAMADGRYGEAVVSFEEALEHCRPLGRVWLLATSHLNLATAVLHAGDIDRAEQGFAEALALYRELGDRRFATRTRMHIAQVALLRGDHETARAKEIDVVAEAAELGDEPSIAEALETLSAVEAEVRPLEAAFLAGVAAALRETMPTRSLPFDRALVERRLRDARARVGDDAWRSASEEGRATSLDHVIERVLRRSDHIPRDVG